MSKYIDSEKLIAEMERRIDSWSTREKHAPVGQGKDTCTSRVTELSDLLSFVTSLTQEQPEVDLEKEIRNYNVPFNDCGWERLTYNTLKEIARHFYELGCSTQYQKDRGEFAKLKAKEWQDGYDEGYAKGLNARKK